MTMMVRERGLGLGIRVGSQEHPTCAFARIGQHQPLNNESDLCIYLLLTTSDSIMKITPFFVPLCFSLGELKDTCTLICSRVLQMGVLSLRWSVDCSSSRCLC